MSTTPSGTISASSVRTALNVTNNASGATNYPTNLISFNDALVRVLAGKATGAISMNDMRNKAGPNAYGTAYDAGACGIVSSTTFSKNFNNGTYGTYRVDTPNSSLCRATVNTGSATISTNSQNVSINVSTLAGYIAGSSDITITVNSGVIVSSTSTSTPALSITGGTTGDTITLVNNGTIVGCGGTGGNSGQSANSGVPGSNGGTGGTGLSASAGITVNIYNNGTIGGGGGGGGGGVSIKPTVRSGIYGGGGGGGGAGYGTGGSGYAGAVGTGGNGGTGTATTGGTGGAGSYTVGGVYGSGGNGGSIGASGSSGSSGGNPAAGSGGSAGSSATGTFTWQVVGSRYN